MMTCTTPGVYFGIRGTEFQKFITGLLKPASKPLKKKYIDLLTDPSSMKIYASAFTSELVDEENNYQVLEQRGDLTGNKFIVEYMYSRFPQLNCCAGVKVVARLRINYGAKQSFSEIARKYGFWQYITAPNDLRQRKMKPLLEDAFEAWIGATESILDQRIGRVGVGYSIVYDILKGIFDQMPISLKYEDLYDAKTRLKETFDMYPNLGSLVYSETKTEMITNSVVTRIDSGKRLQIGSGRAALKADAQQAAATDALVTLGLMGFKKPIPSVYRKFNRNDEKSGEVTISLGDGDINDLRQTKDKTKYQSKYESNELAKMCRLREWKCIKMCLDMGADPDIPDSDGLTCLDLLLIGSVDEKNIESTVEMFQKCSKLVVRKEIWDMYVVLYSGEFVENLSKI